jgi:hypothetical protein
MVRYLRDEFDLLFGSVDQVTGELARAVLSEHGIPSMLHSQGFEADASNGSVSTWFQLFVPKGSKALARSHLRAAWGGRAVDKLDSAHTPRPGCGPDHDEHTVRR